MPKHITIIGAGTAGLLCAQQLKRAQPENTITLIDRRPYYFNRREFIASPLTVPVLDLKPHCQQHGITFMQDTVERVNTTRRRIYCKQNSPQPFEILILASGLCTLPLESSGTHREGFFYMTDINPVLMRNIFKFNNDAAVIAATLLGLRLAARLHALGKNVRVIGNIPSLLGAHTETFLERCAECGLSIHQNTTLEEVIGEGAVKAIKLKPLKVFPAQCVFADSGYAPNTSFFEKTEPSENEPAHKTNEGIFYLGDCQRKMIDAAAFYDDNCPIIAAHVYQLVKHITGIGEEVPIPEQTVVTQEKMAHTLINSIQKLEPGTAQNKLFRHTRNV